jgi:hypothetical protein
MMCAISFSLRTLALRHSVDQNEEINQKESGKTNKLKTTAAWDVNAMLVVFHNTRRILSKPPSWQKLFPGLYKATNVGPRGGLNEIDTGIVKSVRLVTKRNPANPEVCTHLMSGFIREISCAIPSSRCNPGPAGATFVMVGAD